MGFAEELSKRRKAMGMTQEELAEKCDVQDRLLLSGKKANRFPMYI